MTTKTERELIQQVITFLKERRNLNEISRLLEIPTQKLDEIFMAAFTLLLETLPEENQFDLKTQMFSEEGFEQCLAFLKSSIEDLFMGQISEAEIDFLHKDADFVWQLMVGSGFKHHPEVNNILLNSFGFPVSFNCKFSDEQLVKLNSNG